MSALEQSLPTGERGLKLFVIIVISIVLRSLPTGERGLKYQGAPADRE